MQNNSSVRVNQLIEICDRPKPNDSSDRFFAVWGFRTEDLYRISLQFFKEKDGSKAVQISYKERVHLIALSQQVAFGRFQQERAVEIGLFDVVGNDRKLAWQKLGDMPKDAAMCEFISMLSNLCSLFEPFITAHKMEREEQERKRKEEEEELNRQKMLQMEKEEMKMEEEKKRQTTQEAMIRLALNQQTNLQFRTYAEQQYPGKKNEQEHLIAQLREQHFAQYMMQVYNQQSVSTLMTQSPQLARHSSNTSLPSPLSLVSQVQQMPNKTALSLSQATSKSIGSHSSGHPIAMHLTNGTGQQDNNKNLIVVPDHVTSDAVLDKKTVIEAASLWTRRDVQQFKQTLRGEAESLISVGSGATVTVRVPTHEDGRCLFWEFATEGYDIGFGVSFEWTTALSNQPIAEVPNSDIDEGKDEPKLHNTPPIDVIVPVYRRESHIEVHCGSHVYPGRGIYLFIFDNSYSLWRSKIVFYRVYYNR